MRWPIRYQILIPFAGAMLIVVAAVSLLDAHLAARRSDDLVSGRLRDTARTLLDSNFPLTDSVLRQMRGLSGAEYVLTDGAGRSLAASGNLPGELPRPRRVSATWEEVELGQPIQLGSRPYFFTALAIPAARGRGEPLVLNIVYPRESLTQFRRAAAFPHLMVGAAAVALVALLSLAIAGRMCRPLVQVSRQVARLTDEAIHPLPLPPRDDELRDLVLSVNRLAAQLQEMRHAVQRSERLRVLGQLSGGMAHTLRNQATGARLAVQLHQRHCASSDAESLEVALRQLQLSEDHLRRFLAVGYRRPAGGGGVTGRTGVPPPQRRPAGRWVRRARPRVVDRSRADSPGPDEHRAERHRSGGTGRLGADRARSCGPGRGGAGHRFGARAARRVGRSAFRAVCNQQARGRGIGAGRRPATAGGPRRRRVPCSPARCDVL
jgi:HAMP domain-containing protein